MVGHEGAAADRARDPPISRRKSHNWISKGRLWKVMIAYSANARCTTLHSIQWEYCFPRGANGSQCARAFAPGPTAKNRTQSVHRYLRNKPSRQQPSKNGHTDTHHELQLLEPVLVVVPHPETRIVIFWHNYKDRQLRQIPPVKQVHVLRPVSFYWPLGIRTRLESFNQLRQPFDLNSASAGMKAD